MTNKTTIDFSSISSDDNLFDFDMIIRKIRKSMGITEEQYLNKVREHFAKKYPSMNDLEKATVVASFLIAEVTFKRLAETLDILGVSLTLNTTFDTPAKADGKTKLLDMTLVSVPDFHLSGRMLAILEDNGITTLRQLVTLTEEEALKLRHISAQGVDCIKGGLENIGLHFGACNPRK